MSRLASVQGEKFDVVVIGGGIIGCGVARDAAMRGLRVALFERRDFGSGTTAASTRIVHGGLRYLEQFDFRLVRMDLKERETLLRIAPHLIEPLQFLIPFMSGMSVSALKLRVGLTLYDALSPDTSLPRHRVLSASEARAAEGCLQRDDVRGAAAYFDARVDLPERLALENALDAEMHRAIIFNYCEVVPPVTHGGATHRVRVRHIIDGDEAELSARVVVNATGAWWEQTASAQTGTRPARIRTTKGIHIACPPLTESAIVLFSAVDRRLMFAIPRFGQTWIGTTDTDYEGDPADARATQADVDYVLASVRPMFPSLRLEDVRYTTAGVRALVRKPGRPSAVSRMHKIVNNLPSPGIISILGGKITGYRAIAEEAVDAVCEKLKLTARCETAEKPLPGARGTRPLTSEYLDVGAEVICAVRSEHCQRVSDFIRRRTRLGASADQGWSAAPRVAEIMGAELAWQPERIAAEIESYRRDIESTTAFRRRR
ncbi:MAG TPA: glycerol-3-phosphate dehydrogenase/oxidase [Vicinamibacterales bacterium]|nr:glycerol-3-phosphate dehydrogenase/oxidase [Vicinamibacterales bacterium]